MEITPPTEGTDLYRHHQTTQIRSCVGCGQFANNLSDEVRMKPAKKALRKVESFYYFNRSIRCFKSNNFGTSDFLYLLIKNILIQRRLPPAILAMGKQAL